MPTLIPLSLIGVLLLVSATAAILIVAILGELGWISSTHGHRVKLITSTYFVVFVIMIAVSMAAYWLGYNGVV